MKLMTEVKKHKRVVTANTRNVFGARNIIKISRFNKNITFVKKLSNLSDFMIYSCFIENKDIGHNKLTNIL